MVHEQAPATALRLGLVCCRLTAAQPFVVRDDNNNKALRLDWDAMATGRCILRFGNNEIVDVGI